jgi:hypothetical protein
MIVTLDGERVNRTFAPDSTLQGVLDQVRPDLRAGRLFVAVAIDGRECTQAQLEELLPKPVDVNSQVDLESGDRAALAVTALRCVADELGEAGQRQQQVAGLLHAGQVAEAIRRVGEVVQTWQAARDVVVQCGGLIERDLTAEQFQGQSVDQWLLQLIEQLRELRDALDARDMVILADLVQYEMPELCGTWHDLLNSVADGIAEAAAGEV